MRIGVDMDGVIYSFVDSLRHYLVTHKGFEKYDLGESTSWNFFKDNWGMSTVDFLQHFEDGVNAGVVFLHGKPEEGAMKHMRQLREDGHTIHIVTHRSVGKKSIQNTGEWLHREHIEFDEITFAQDKTTVRDLDVFIEDNIENFLTLEQAGVRSVIMDRPWNRELDTPFRVNGWEEFYHMIGDMNA
jgi:5'(3')-deoxyribonucleotidase